MINYRKAVMIGCGFVGSASVFSLMQSGLFSEIAMIDVDKEKELATRFRISSVPTLIIFKNGKQQWRQSGIISALALMKLLQEYQ